MSEVFLRNARGLPMCSQVLCHGLYMMSALSVFPHSLLMSSAHKAMRETIGGGLLEDEPHLLKGTAKHS